MTDATVSLRVVDRGDRRQSRDRLELLTTLLNGPTVEPFYRDEIVRYPPEHRVFAWKCSVASCDSPRTGHKDMCHQHIKEWARHKGQRRKPVRVRADRGPVGHGFWRPSRRTAVFACIGRRRSTARTCVSGTTACGRLPCEVAM